MTHTAHPWLRSGQQLSRAGWAASLAHQHAVAMARHARAVQAAQAWPAPPDDAAADDDRCAGAGRPWRCAVVDWPGRLADPGGPPEAGRMPDRAGSSPGPPVPARARRAASDPLQARMAEPTRTAHARLVPARHLHPVMAVQAVRGQRPSRPAHQRRLRAVAAAAAAATDRWRHTAPAFAPDQRSIRPSLSI